MQTIAQIRDQEKLSHEAFYESSDLYQDGSWLRKPVKTVLELFPHFQQYPSLRVLDLGCGVGRNCLAIAQHFQDIPCSIDCLDILELAIKKLTSYAQQHGLSQNIQGIVGSIDDFPILENTYDWILAVSALEHVHSQACLRDKLLEIRSGIRPNGVVCLIMNSEVKEMEVPSGKVCPASFEVNLSSSGLLDLLESVFYGWKIQKQTIRSQTYEIPRGQQMHKLTTNVVTFVAVK